jgi:hypothetical protein
VGTESFLERSEVWMDANKGVGIKAVETMEGKENLEGESKDKKVQVPVETKKGKSGSEGDRV